MRIQRHYTTAGQDPYAKVPFRSATSEIRNPDGSVVFKLDAFDVPSEWSQVAADVLAQKYFRRAGIPSRLKSFEENDVPSWLWRKVPDTTALDALPKAERTRGESSAREVFDRLAGTWTYWGWKGGYFGSPESEAEEDARAYYDEMRFMLATQMGAPNSPQWFNTGLHWAYGIEGPAQGHHYVDWRTGEMMRSTNAYEHPQPHACFIQGVEDNLVEDGGIMDLWLREARLFKYGSGTGSNFSSLRGEAEKLSGGGKSSGLMSFLKIGDRAAGAIKSGGTTRRAAKMVVVDMDHPDVEDFIDWKVVEEQKVANLVTGSRVNHKHLAAVLKACNAVEGERRFTPSDNPELKKAIRAARGAQVPENYIQRMIDFARQGFTDAEFDFPTYNTDWDGDAYFTVSGQNANNTVRVTDEFLAAVQGDKDWNLTFRSNGKVAKTLKARELWEKVSLAAWQSADPGIQFHTTINDWHTCPAGGDIRASNPCSEYMFLDDTACNLASLNLMTFRNADGTFDTKSFVHSRVAVDAGARNLGDDGAVPVAQDRRVVLPLPHPRPRLRQLRRPLDGRWHSLRQRRGSRDLRRDLGAHDRRVLRDVRRDGSRAWRVRGLRGQPPAHAARHPQPRARSRCLGGQVRRPARRPGVDGRGQLQGQGSGLRRPRVLEGRAGPWHQVRFP